MTVPRPLNAAIAIIGDEVLTGKTHDTNSYWLAAELFALGVSLQRIVVLHDSIEEIAAVVGNLASQYDVVFTSGGIGPTHDDVTYVGVAKAFALKLIRHPELVERIRRHCRGTLNEERLKMADIPEPDELCSVEPLLTPVVRVRNVYILPGVPPLFRQLFGAIRERFRVHPVFLAQVFTRQAEGDLAATLNKIVAEHVQVRIGSYPRMDDADYRVKLAVESHDQQAVSEALDAIVAGLDAQKIVRIVQAEQVCAPLDTEPTVSGL